MRLRPLEDLAQLWPIVDRLEIVELDRRTGDDHAVVTLVANVVEPYIERFQMLSWHMRSAMADRLQKIDLDLQRRIGKLTQDLCFRFDLGGHQVQDEHAQRANILMDRAMFGHHEDILTFKHTCCR